MTMEFYMNNLTPQITSTFEALTDTFTFLKYFGVYATKIIFTMSTWFLFKI